MENVKQTKTLNEYRSQILKETAMVGVKPYSDNLVSILLRRVAEDFGSAEANAIILEYGLDKMGWSVKTT